jgi:phospholipase/lecithinase/hemolysin
MNDYDWDLEDPNRRLTGILDQTNIPYLDLLPVFRTVAGQPDAPPLHFLHDGHWTPGGHQLAAEAIASFLKTQNLLAQ